MRVEQPSPAVEEQSSAPTVDAEHDDDDDGGGGEEHEGGGGEATPRARQPAGATAGSSSSSSGPRRLEAVAAAPSAAAVAAVKGAFRTPRERAEPGVFSSADKVAYRALWASGEESGWDVFLVGADFESARMRPQTRDASRKLPATPGLYEFAVTAAGAGSKDQQRRVVVVYVGETGSLRSRHLDQYGGKSGSHLRALFDEALAAGMTVWRRVRVMGHREVAARWQNAFLFTYDYAWNSALNGARRPLFVEAAPCGAECCAPIIRAGAAASAGATRKNGKGGQGRSSSSSSRRA